MFDEKDGYLGFTFAGHHSSEFELLVVSDGSRYHQNLFSNFSDTITQVPGMNGGYYFGTQLAMRDFDIQCVFDNMNSHTKQKIEHWLYPNKTGWLIFDEMPYKKYYVKISQVPQFSFLPFDEFKTKGNLRFQRDILKGEFNISFFSFYEYAIGNENYELPSFTTNEVIRHHAIDSGLLPINYSHEGILTSDNNTTTEVEKTFDTLDEISVTSGFSIYNAGTGVADANFYFTIDGNQISEHNPLIIYNYDDGNDYTINDPSSIIKEYIQTDIDPSCEYRIEILGSKKEIWLTYISGNTQSNKINIGACYNHYFPKINHKKPSDIMIVNQSRGHGIAETEELSEIEKWSGEPLFYSYSWENNTDFISSVNNGNTPSSFEEIKHDWSDYTIVAKNKIYQINNIVNPATIFFSDEEGEVLENSLVFLIYPNKFSSNKPLRNFTVQFKNTYI